MINREYKDVNVLTFTDEVDDYGQKRQGTSTVKDIKMVCKLYSNNSTNSPKYNDVEVLGITKDKTITDANQISIDGVVYNVLFIIPSGQYTQVMMKKA